MATAAGRRHAEPAADPGPAAPGQAPRGDRRRAGDQREDGPPHDRATAAPGATAMTRSPSSEGGVGGPPPPGAPAGLSGLLSRVFHSLQRGIAESVLAEHPDWPADRAAQVQCAFEEYLDRDEAGEAVDISAFC